MASTHERTGVSGRWIGTPQDVMRLVAVFEEDTTLAVHINIEESLGDVTREHALMPSQLRDAWESLTLSGIRRVVINGMRAGVRDEHAYLDMRDIGSHVAMLSASGEDAAWVDSTYDRLARVLAQREHRPRAPRSAAINIALLGMILIPAVFAVVLFTTNDTAFAIATAGPLLVIASVVGAAFAGMIPSIFPMFAIVEEGYASPLTRLRAEVPGLVKAILLLVIGALIGHYIS